MSQAQFILGPAVERFEKAFAAYIGRKYCVGLNNGTSALHMALQACDIGPGDEVITTPHTWISTSWAISYVGAKPVYVDIDPATYNIDPGADRAGDHAANQGHPARPSVRPGLRHGRPVRASPRNTICC